MLRSLFGNTIFWHSAIEGDAVLMGMEIKPVIIDGVPPSTCIFCSKFTTSIDFDMDLHLYANHRKELYRLPLGKGFSIDSRIGYVIGGGRKVYEFRKGGQM